MTFRVGEGEVEAEVLREEPINPSIEVEVGLPTMMNIESGTRVKQQTLQTPQGTSQESMRIEKESGVPAQEERDPVGGKRAMRGREAEEIIIKRVGETTGEIIAKAQVEETTAQTDKVGETTVQDTGKMKADPGVEETTHLRRAEGTLVRTDEGVAQGPLVMEGP